MWRPKLFQSNWPASQASFALTGLARLSSAAHGLRRGLQSFAALRLDWTLCLQAAAGFDTISAPFDATMNNRYLHRIRVKVCELQFFVPSPVRRGPVS